MGFLANIIWTFVVVGVIIFFHELGHFLGCKKVGIKVQRFSIGFGPKMIGFTRGDTEYRISWLPFFGGYVKMLGENPAERPDENAPGEQAEPEEGRFDLAPVSHRVIVAASGPGMNMVLAVIAFAVAFMIGLPADPDTTIGYVEPGSPASKAGIQRGDRIISVGGYKVKTWGDIQENVMTRPEEEIEVTLLRNKTEEIDLRVRTRYKELLIASISPDLQSELDSEIISVDLRQEFGINNLLLSHDAAISVEDRGSKWLVTDKNRKYVIEKEEDRLDIYQETDAEEIKPVFSIDLPVRSGTDLRDDLDNGTIPKVLRQKFEDSDNALSSDAQVLVKDADKRWLITDKVGRRGILRWLIPDKDRRYHVRLEEDTLNIYWEIELGEMGVVHWDTVVKEVKPDSVVAQAGLRPGDVIETVNHNEVASVEDFLKELQGASGESVTLTVKRNEGKVEIPIALEFDEEGRLTSFEGLSFEELVRRNPITAFAMAVPETIRMGGKIFQYLKRMIVGQVSMKYLAGPVGIIQVTMAVVKTGIAGTLRFAGFLSVNLGIVNLLPLFITDGAMIIFLVIEKLRGKPMNRKRQMIIQQVGVGFIIFTFLLLTYNDILRLFVGPF